MSVLEYAAKDTSNVTFGIRDVNVYSATKYSASILNWEGTETWGVKENILTDVWNDACFTNSETPGFTLDLGSVQRIDSVVTVPVQASAGYYAEDYTISVSTDNVNYTDVVSRTGDINTANDRTYQFSAVNARYIKMSVTKYSAKDSYGVTFGLRGFFVYGSPLPGAVSGGDYYEATDPIFTYYGRWTQNGTEMTAGWGTSKLRFSFTGTKFDVYTDAADGVYMGAYTAGEYPISASANEGIFSFTFTNGGSHEVLLFTDTSSSKNSNVKIRGIMVEKGAQISKTALTPKTVEIVGDSISDGWFGVRTSSYITDTCLGWESINLSYAGITLSDVWNWASTTNEKGLASLYFQSTNSFTDDTQWNFPIEKEPDYIYINIGTNDFGQEVPEDEFEVTYCNFLEKVRQKNPNATIFCISPYGGFYNDTFVHAMETPIANAVTSRQLSGDDNLFYIDTKGLLTADTARDYLADDLHPAETAFDHFSNWIVPRIRAVLEETDHNFEQTEYVAPTANQDGYRDSKCKICGMAKHEILKATGISQTPPATGVRSSFLLPILLILSGLFVGALLFLGQRKKAKNK